MTTEKRRDEDIELGLPLEEIEEITDSGFIGNDSELSDENRAPGGDLYSACCNPDHENLQNDPVYLDEIADTCFEIRKITEAFVVPELKDVHSRVEDLHREFHEKIRHDASREKLIDHLHQELQEYRDDFVKTNLKSIVLDIIKTIDDIRKLVDYYQVHEPSSDDIPKLLTHLAGISTDLEDICLWHGVERFNAENEKFDPVRQKTLKRIETSHPEKDKCIAEQLRPGYLWEGKVLRPEIVSVYVYRETLAELIELEKRDSDD